MIEQQRAYGLKQRKGLAHNHSAKWGGRKIQDSHLGNHFHPSTVLLTALFQFILQLSLRFRISSRLYKYFCCKLQLFLYCINYTRFNNLNYTRFLSILHNKAQFLQATIQVFRVVQKQKSTKKIHKNQCFTLTHTNHPKTEIFKRKYKLSSLSNLNISRNNSRKCSS